MIDRVRFVWLLAVIGLAFSVPTSSADAEQLVEVWRSSFGLALPQKTSPGLMLG